MPATIDRPLTKPVNRTALGKKILQNFDKLNEMAYLYRLDVYGIDPNRAFGCLERVMKYNPETEETLFYEWPISEEKRKAIKKQYKKTEALIVQLMLQDFAEINARKQQQQSA